MLVRNAFSVISAGTERAIVNQSRKSLIEKARERPDLVKEVVGRAAREGVRSTSEQVRRKLSEETIVGYSSAGWVIEVGPAVRGFSAGDLVACAGVGYANHADLVAVPRNLCARVPAEVRLETAAFTTIAAIALHGIRLGNVRVGDRVAVVGCGLVGQIALRLLRAAGAETFALDIEPARVEEALASGADHGVVVGPEAGAKVEASTLGVGVDQALVAAAAPTNEPLLLAGEIARDRGVIIVVGDVPVDLPRAALFEKELLVRVSRSYGPGRYDADYEERGFDYPIGYVRWTEQRNMEAILGLQARGRLEVGDLIEEVLPAERAPEAYARITGEAGQRPSGAIVLSYGSPGPEKSADNGTPADATVPARCQARTVAHGAPVRVGLIGPGAFAMSVLVPALEAAGARLEVVGGGSGPSASTAVRNYGFARVAETPDALIEDDQVDAVVIATPHASHAPLSRRALEAGRHVFCEKPLALTVEELTDVIAAWAPGLALAVGFNRRFSPLVREACEFMAAIGGVKTATYRISAGQVPAGHWIQDLAEGGGRMLGEVCHFIDTLVYLTGAQVTTVHAVGHGGHGLPVQSHDNLVINLTFSDGSIGSVTYVAQGSPRVPKERVEVFAGKRTAVLDDYRSLVLFDEGHSERRRLKSQDKGHRDELAAFVAAVRWGELPVPLQDVENVSLATIAVVDSLRRCQPVKVDKAGR